MKPWRFIRALKLVLAIACGAALSEPLLAQEKLRIIVETDAGGDPDDEQSLVRFLLYVNEWDVEGIIANRPTARPGENLNPARTGLEIVRRHLDAYRAVHPRLKENAMDFPSPDQLWERTVSGSAQSNAGVDLILKAVDSADARPVWFLNWGTDHGSDPSNLRRALDKVLTERGPEGYATFKNRILLSSDDPFGEHTFNIRPAWRLWVDPAKPRMDGAFMYHRFSPLTSTAGGFDLVRDVLTGHGPLGALYPTNTNLRQKEGDSPYFLYLIPTGMNDPFHPTWGSWAGRFGTRDDQPSRPEGWYWANVRDNWQGTTNRDNTLLRWAADLQNDFRARLDWCVKPFAEANHAPSAVVNGDTSRKILFLTAKAGTTLRLDASDSSDPDAQALSFHWMSYPEAGTYRGNLALENADQSRVSLQIPPDAANTEVHILLTVRDQGNPPLASWRRVIVRVLPANSK